MGFLKGLLGMAVRVASGADSAESSPPGEPGFAARLHGQLASTPGNLFYSPASIRLALAMAQAGARGDTASQMQRVLALPAHPGPAFKALLADWRALPAPAQLHVANRLWGAQGTAFQDAFLRTLREDYATPLETLDFKGDPEASRRTINDAVAKATQDKIQNLVPPRTLDAATRLVLTNAIYFRARWQEPFPAFRTRPEPFQLPTGPVPVPLMHQVAHFPLAELPEGQLLELPYQDGRLAMGVLLPRTSNGLATMEKAFNGGAFPAWLKRLESRKVDVALPRFKAAATFQLAEALQAMGVKHAFVYGKADFSGMDGTHELYLSQLIHQACVDVNETGTEAAAATAVMMRAGGPPPSDQPVVFRADHPFLFALRDTGSGEILFGGRIVDPR